MSDPKLIPIPDSVLKEERLGGVLNGFSTPEDARGIMLDNVGFWNGKEGKDSAYFSGKEHPQAITDKSLDRIRYKADDGSVHYYKRVDYEDGKTSLEFQVGQLYKSINKEGVTDTEKKAAFAAIDAKLGTKFASKMPESSEALANAISENKRYHDVKENDKFKAFLKDVQSQKNGELPATNLLKTYNIQESPHGNNSGMHVSAWKEIDDKTGKPILVNGREELLVDYTGFLGIGSGKDKSNDTKSMDTALNGKLHPQALDAVSFTHRVITEEGGKDKISDVKFIIHGFGSGQAIAADAAAKLDGIKNTDILNLNPGIASGQKRIIEGEMQNPASDLSHRMQAVLNKTPDEIKAAAAIVEKDSKEHTVSIEAITKDSKGQYHGSKVENGDIGWGGGVPYEGLAGTAYNYFIRDDHLAGTLTEKFPALKKLGLASEPPDRVITGTSYESNAPTGTTYLQLVQLDDKNPTTSAIGKWDPAFQLARMVDQAKQGTYYQVVHADAEHKTPGSSPANASAAGTTPHK